MHIGAYATIKQFSLASIVADAYTVARARTNKRIAARADWKERTRTRTHTRTHSHIHSTGEHIGAARRRRQESQAILPTVSTVASGRVYESSAESEPLSLSLVGLTRLWSHIMWEFSLQITLPTSCWRRRRRRRRCYHFQTATTGALQFPYSRAAARALSFVIHRQQRRRRRRQSARHSVHGAPPTL